MADAFPHSEFREFPRELAEQIRQEFPKLWSKHGTGGNPPTAFTGDHAYMLWGLWRAGDRSPEVRDWAERRREAYASRHRKDFRKGGVIAAIKWGVVLPIGLNAMLVELGGSFADAAPRRNGRSLLEQRLARAAQVMHSTDMEYRWLTEGWPGRMVRNPSQTQINEQYKTKQHGFIAWADAMNAGLAAGLTYDQLDVFFAEGEQTAANLFRLIHGGAAPLAFE